MKFKHSSAGSLRVAIAVAGLAIGANAAIAEGVEGAAAPETIEQAGQKHFRAYCAVCHGEDASGKGPYASVLKKPPADLTLISKNNGGNFPFDTVYAMIDGREMLAAHGTREMPIWGIQWRRDQTEESRIGTEATVRARVLELIVYLRSIQK